jgi:tetratricopeptide (TPR) repeat protein
MHPWLVLLVFVLVAFATYFPSLNGERIWDDHYLVGENPFFRSPVFAVEVFKRHLFTESFSTYYRPVQNLSYMVDYWLWGESTTGYHCTNVLIHAFVAWLLFLLLRRLLPALWKSGPEAPVAALLVALVWLVHPVHNAAVAYISGRADSLAALFALGAWLLWIRARECSRRAAQVACGFAASVLFLLALCSKEIALVWALLFCLHAVVFERSRSRLGRFLPVGGVAVLVAIYAVLHALPEHRAGLPAAVAGPEPFGGRVVLALRALGDYCGLMFAPVRLMMERTLGPADMYASRAGWWRGITSEYLSILGAAALVAAGWLCLRRGEGRSLRRFGALWFFVAFVPISNLIPLNAEVAEHWIYAASIGFLMFMAGVVAMLPPRAVRWSGALALAAACVLAVRTGVRAGDWANAERFARKTITSGGASPSPRILAYLAQELGRQGRVAEQEQIYRKTLAIYPGFMTARINLGLCLQKQGRAEEAKPLLDIGRAATVVADVPRTWNAALNAAGQLHKEGRSAEALALVREWKPANPHTWELRGFEANVLRETEGPRAALAVVEDYARAHWWHLPSQIGMASLQRETGDFALALATARDAQRLDIRSANAFDEAAKCEVSLGKFSDALESQAIAVARAPGNAAYLDFFSVILRQLGRDAEAAAVHRKAVTLAAASGQRLL